MAAVPITVGQKFANYGEFKAFLKSYEDSIFCKYVVVDSRTIEQANKLITRAWNKFPEKLKYSRLRFACKHAGQYRSRSTGKRPNQRTYKSGCESGFLINADRKTSNLIVTEVNLQHNHAVARENYERYPELRRLDKQSEDLGRTMFNLSVPSKAFRETLIKVSGKMLTSRDIDNLKAKLKKENVGENSDVHMLMVTLDEILMKEPDAVVQLSVDEDGKILCLFLQLPFMKRVLENFPELLLLDATYRVNSSKMPLFTIIAEDGNGCSIPVAHFFVSSECADVVKLGFQALEKSVGKELLLKNQLYLVDKDFTEISQIKKYFPNAKIHLCLFHVMKTFKKEIPAYKGQKKTEILDLLQKLVYSNTESVYNKHFKKLQDVAQSNFLQYYTKNWHNCREMWVCAWRNQSITFGNRTINRLESFHQKLKTTMKSSHSLAKCVKVLVHFSAQKQQEALHTLFLSNSTISYCATRICETSRQVYAMCTPYAAKQVTDSLNQKKKMLGQYACEKVPEGYSIRHVTKPEGSYIVNDSMDSCSCTYNSTMLLPCKHIFFVRAQSCNPSLSVFEGSLVANRWKKDYQFFVSDKDPACGRQLMSPVTVVCKTNATRVLNRCEKYNKALNIFKEVASAMADHGQSKFDRYVHEMQMVKDVITSGKDLCLVIENEENSGDCSAPVGPMSKAAPFEESRCQDIVPSPNDVIDDSAASLNAIVEENTKEETSSRPSSPVATESIIKFEYVVEESQDLASSHVQLPSDPALKPVDVPSGSALLTINVEENMKEENASCPSAPAAVEPFIKLDVVEESKDLTSSPVQVPSDPTLKPMDVDASTEDCKDVSDGIQFDDDELPDLGGRSPFSEKVDVNDNPQTPKKLTLPPCIPSCNVSFLQLLKGKSNVHLPATMKTRGRPKGSNLSATGLQKKSGCKPKINTNRKRKGDDIGKTPKAKAFKMTETTTAKQSQNIGTEPQKKSTKVSDQSTKFRFQEKFAKLSPSELQVLYDKCKQINCGASFKNVTSMINAKCSGSYTLLSGTDESAIFDMMPFLLKSIQDPGRKDVDVLMVTSAVLLRAFEVELDPYIVLETLKDIPSHLTNGHSYIKKAVKDKLHADLKVNLYVGNNSLNYEDLKTLEPAKWLNDKVVHAYLNILARDVNASTPNIVYVLPSFLALKWEKGDYQSWLFQKVTIEDYRWVLLPICTASHWFLLVADMTANTVGVLNSLNWNENRYGVYYKSWRLFMKARGCDVDWSVMKYPCCTQEDGNSCGVFVLMNAEALLKDVPPVVMRQFHCEMYRQYILGRLLHCAKSNEAEIICDLPFCEKPAGERIPWTQCDYCNRWMHNCCVGLPTDDVDENDSQSNAYKCIYCVM